MPSPVRPSTTGPRSQIGSTMPSAEEFAAALTNALHKEFDYLSRAADKQVPCHERFVLVVHGADAAELNAHVLNFVNRLTGLFNQHTKDGRITAIVVELQSRVEHLLHGRLNTVLLLVARADAERPLREQPGAAEERFFFKHDRFHAFLNGSIRGGKACKAAAHDDKVDLLFNDGSLNDGRCCCKSSGSGRRAEKLAAIELRHMNLLVSEADSGFLNFSLQSHGFSFAFETASSEKIRFGEPFRLCASAQCIVCFFKD